MHEPMNTRFELTWITSPWSDRLALGLATTVVGLSTVWWPLETTTLVLAFCCGLAVVAACFRYPRFWVYCTAVAALVIPGLYLQVMGGESPLYVSNALFGVGILIVILKGEDIRVQWEGVGQASMLFLVALLASLPFAFWLSGSAQGSQSLLRFVLIIQPFFAYLWIRSLGPFDTEQQLRTLVKVLLGFGFISAAYGIADFYYPIPLPHPFADQYIYLDFGHIRRAQGIFYEASSFGNVCAFMVCLAVCLLLSIRRLTIAQRVVLALAAGTFTTALFLSYSRGSWMAVTVAISVFLILQRQLKVWNCLFVCFMFGGFILMVYQFSQDVVVNFFNWRLGTLIDFWQDPNTATSGRWANWATLWNYFATRPWLVLFGIGYKSIPYTPIFGKPVVADNGYMSLLFEAGIPGLAAFVWLNYNLMRLLSRCRKAESHLCRLLASFLIAFWCGELAQMLTGDIFTFWRNLTVMFVLIAAVQSLAENGQSAADLSRRPM